MKLILIISHLLIMTFASAASSLSFKDSCSKKESTLYTSNGLDIKFTLDDYNRFDKMTVTAEFYPVKIGIKKSEKPSLSYTYKYRKANSRLRRRLPKDELSVNIKIPKKSKLIKIQKKLKASSLWVVKVHWNQKKSNLSGNIEKEFFNINEAEVFYEIKSSGICHWETKPSVSSKIYNNKTMNIMSINKEYSSIRSWQTGTSGSLGPNNTYANTPLSYEDNMGWLFKESGTIYGEESSSRLERIWELNRYESGVFATRYSFTRKKVQRWAWGNGYGGCSEYIPSSEGYLDIGITTEDFYILPEEIYSTPEMNEYIQNNRPTLDTCSKNLMKGPQNAEDIIINKDNSILYYYSNKDLL